MIKKSIWKKCIFWDSDGTLLYGNESFKCSLVRVFEEFGYTLEEAQAREFMRSVCSWYVPEKDHSDKSGEEWWEELLGETRVFCEGHGVGESDIIHICNSFRKMVITFEYEAYSDAKKFCITLKKRVMRIILFPITFLNLAKCLSGSVLIAKYQDISFRLA